MPMVENYGSFVVNNGTEVDPNKILPEDYYYEMDGEKLALRKINNTVDAQVMKFGSLESDTLKYNKPLGGLRFMHPNGVEYFIARSSPTGDGKAAVFGNYDSPAGNYIATSEAGTWEVQLTDEPSGQEVSYSLSTNVRGGTRLTILLTADADTSLRSIDLGVNSAVGPTKFNTFVTNNAGDFLYSDHQSIAEYDAGYGKPEFSKTFIVGGNSLLMAQPFPVFVGTQIRIVYDFEAIVDIAGSMYLIGLKLRKSKVTSIAYLTQTEREAISGTGLWDGRVVYQTTAPKGLYTYQDSTWTNLSSPTIAAATNTTAGSVKLSNASPIVNGTATSGTGTFVSRDDHVHPTDTSRAAVASPMFTGTPSAPTATADTNTTQIASTAFVVGQAGTATPLMSNVTPAVGTSLKYARQDHVHPKDSSIPLTTDALTEGTTNKYYTDARVSTYLSGNGYINAASSVGAGASVYKAVTSGNVSFRSVVQGRGISVTLNTNDITIAIPNSPLVYDSSGLVASPKTWVGSGTTTSGGVFTIDISSAGFTTIKSVTPSVVYSNATANNREWATLSSVSTTSVSGYTLTGMGVLVGGTTVDNGGTGRTVYLTVHGV